MIAVLIIAVLLLLNAFFVAAEFAIVGAPRAAIDARARAGDRLARLRAGRAATTRHGRIATSRRRRSASRSRASGSACTASTCSPTGCSHALGQRDVGGVARGARVRERRRGRHPHLLPHRARRDAAEVAGAAVGRADGALADAADAVDPDAALSVRLALNGLGNALLKPFGITPQAHNADQYYTPEELQLIVEESEEQGALRGGVEPGAPGAVRVRRADRRRGDGAARPHRRHPGGRRRRTTCAPILGRTPRTRYPVYEGDLDHIVGTYHIKDLLRLLLNGQPVTAAGARPVPVVPGDGAARRGAGDDAPRAGAVRGRHRRARRHRRRRHAGGSLRGGRRRNRGGPRAATGPRRDAAGRLRVPGTMRLDELGQLFDLELAHEEVDSVSGLMLTLLGRPPRVGDSRAIRSAADST